MKSFVVDASVVIKWVFPERADEDHLPQALNLLGLIQQGAVKILQPPHWLAEAAAVIVRIQPKIAVEAVDLLSMMQLTIADSPEIYHLACQLSEKFKHHIFDTLYHAVAIYNGDTQFITADDKYYQKAKSQGSILRLADFTLFTFEN